MDPMANGAYLPLGSLNKAGHETLLKPDGCMLEVVFWPTTGSLEIDEQWKHPGCLGYIGDSTTHLSADYNKPL